MLLNPITSVQKRTYNLITSFTPKTSNDEKRLNKATERYNEDVIRKLTMNTSDSGLYGKVKEILNHSRNSKIIDVQSQNVIDNYIFVNDIRVSLEEKSNYTDIDKWINKSENWQKTHYIHYTIDDYTKETISKKTGKITPAKHFYFDGVLTFYDLFSIGYMFDKIKPHTTTNGDTHIYLRHSLKMCKYLNSLNIVPFNRDGRYVTDDFIIEW